MSVLLIFHAKFYVTVMYIFGLTLDSIHNRIKDQYDIFPSKHESRVCVPDGILEQVAAMIEDVLGFQSCDREQYTQHIALSVVMSTPTKSCTTLPSLTTSNRQNVYVGFPRLTTPLDSINMSLHTIHHHHANHVPRGRGLAGGPCPLQVSI